MCTNSNSNYSNCIFTVLHAMLKQSSDENSVCPSVSQTHAL